MDFDAVGNGLFIGSRRGMQDFLASHSNAVVYILTVESENLPEVPQKVTQHKFIQVDDVKTADLLSHFDDMVAFIKSGVLQGVVYVHCRHGISRSAAACAAYLMSKYGIDAEAAIQRLRQCRPFVSPNDGFRRQLELYGRLGCSASLRQPEFRRYRLRAASRAIATDSSLLPALSAPLMLPDGGLPGSVAVYRCSQCRTALFSEEAVVPDDGVKEGGSVPVDGSYRLLPLPWMDEVTRQTRGRLSCPRCSRKLGSFSWLPDVKFATESEFEPSFLITRSRVDRCLPGIAAAVGSGHLAERRCTTVVDSVDR